MPILVPSTTLLTFLSLCQETASLAGIPGGGPTSVVDQTGEKARVVSWVRNAYIDVQRRHETWAFLKKDLSFTTTTGGQVYTLTDMGATDLNLLDVESLRIYQTTLGVADEQFMVEWDYESMRDTYQYGTQTPGRPTCFAQREDRALVLGPKADATGYTIVGRYWRTPHTLMADSDEPLIPNHFRMVIVYRALLKYAGYEAAAEVKTHALEEYGSLMRELERNQLPPLCFGAPLA
jgi:hypothetical protein